MVKTSTLIYLLDDFNNPSDIILSQPYQTSLQDEHLLSLLDIIAIDPGEDIVMNTLEYLK
ncbi:MAG: hypothetical protein K9J30_06785 [Bacteroidales bacterium]|nr:hypothetical protein [Bacteroidales bacterium]